MKANGRRTIPAKIHEGVRRDYKDRITLSFFMPGFSAASSSLQALPSAPGHFSFFKKCKENTTKHTRNGVKLFLKYIGINVQGVGLEENSMRIIFCRGKNIQRQGTMSKMGGLYVYHVI